MALTELDLDLGTPCIIVKNEMCERALEELSDNCPKYAFKISVRQPSEVLEQNVKFINSILSFLRSKKS
jgi:hypothetical protein